MYERFISSSMLTGTRDWISDMRYGVGRLMSGVEGDSSVVTDSESFDPG
jgi:hypothetical protein